MALATLDIELNARLAKLTEGMDKAARLSEKTAAQIQGSFDKLNAITAGLGTTIAGAFSADVLRQFVASTLEGIDKINDLSDATGASVENVSALDDIARRTGSSLEAAGNILVKFNAALKDADPKSGAAAAIKALGLNVTELKKLDPAEALRQTAVAFAQFEDNGSKARQMQELFGRSTKEAAAFLKDLAEQTKLTGSLSKDAAEQADKFSKSISALQANLGNIGRGIALEVIPGFNAFIEKMQESVKQSGFLVGAYKAIREEQLRLITAPFSSGPGGLKANDEAIKSTALSIEFLQKKLDSGRGGPDTAARLEALKKRMQELNDLKPFFPGGASYGNEGRDRPESLPWLPDPAGGGGSKAVKEYFSALKSAQEQYKADFLKSEKDVYGLVPLPEVVTSAITVSEELQKQLFLISEKGAYDIKEVEKEKFDRIADFAAQAGTSIRDELGASVYDALNGDFANIEKAWGDLLKRLVAKAIETQLADYLIGKDNKSGVIGDGLNLLTKFLFSANGNAFGPGGQITAFANGGIVGSPTLFQYGRSNLGLMGEAGPEAVMPLKRGKDGKLGVAGGGSVVNNFYAEAGPTRAEILTSMQQMVAASEGRTNLKLRKAGVA